MIRNIFISYFDKTLLFSCLIKLRIWLDPMSRTCLHTPQRRTRASLPRPRVRTHTRTLWIFPIRLDSRRVWSLGSGIQQVASRSPITNRINISNFHFKTKILSSLLLLHSGQWQLECVSGHIISKANNQVPKWQSITSTSFDKSDFTKVIIFYPAK